MNPKPQRQQFADTMLDLGQTDPRLVVLIGDISHFILQPFAKACPGRFHNIGICEPTIVSMGAGLAKAGLVPVLHTIAPFLLERSFEQLKLDFGYHGLGGNLITLGGAFDYANLGCTHHCYDDWALLKSIPGAQIVHPGSSVEFDTLFRQIYDNGHLNLFRLTDNSHGMDLDPADVVFGRGLRLAEGMDLTLVATGSRLQAVLGARSALEAQGVRADLLYLPTIHPADLDLVEASVRKTRAVLVAEEHLWTGSLGEDVQHRLFGQPDIRFAWAGLSTEFIRSYRSYTGHCEAMGLDAAGLAERALRCLERKNHHG